MTLQKAISPKQLASTNFKTIALTGKLADLIGTPELAGAWLIWGSSGNGKTRLALEICKQLTPFGRVLYNSLEEGQALSMKQAFEEVNMIEVGNRIQLLNAEPIEALKVRLRKRRSPDIVAIDSVQYTGMNYRDYKDLRDEFPKKLFILISHADGREPAGRVARSIRYDAFVKIRVEGYCATAMSRYGGGKPYIIWKKGHDSFKRKEGKTFDLRLNGQL